MSISRWVASGAMVVCLAGLSCGPYIPPEPTFPLARWGQNYAFNFETPPPVPANSVDVAIIVVDSEFQKSVIFDDATYRPLGKGMARSFGVDLQKVIVAKGMTAMGPYTSYDEVVYSDKKTASLMLAPKLEIEVSVTYFGPATKTTGVNHALAYEHRMSRDFQMTVTGYLTLMLVEPMSREKMWIKKLEFDQVTLQGVEQWEAVPEYTPTYGLFGEVTGKTLSGWHEGQMVYDGKPEVLADAVQSFYQSVMGKCWALIDPAEIIDLKAQAEEIRAKAEYTARPSY